MMYSGKYEMLVFFYLKFQVFDRVFILLETGLFLSISSAILQPKEVVRRTLKMKDESSSFQVVGEFHIQY